MRSCYTCLNNLTDEVSIKLEHVNVTPSLTVWPFSLFAVLKLLIETKSRIIKARQRNRNRQDDKDIKHP